MVIEAGAGTGKTSTLRLLAASTLRRGHYLAFNKAIVEDVKGTITRRVTASTAHSLAFRAVGRPYAPRLNAPRMAGWDIAQRLDVRGHVVKTPMGSKHLGDGYLGGLVLRAVTIFC